MVNPISETAAVSVNTEVINKNPVNTAPKSANAAQFEVVVKADTKTDGVMASLETEKSVKENADPGMMAGANGEVRKSELDDGKVVIKVYDGSGKLLRKIPPGYLPLGEQKFDVTV